MKILERSVAVLDLSVTTFKTSLQTKEKKFQFLGWQRDVITVDNPEIASDLEIK